MAYKQVILLIDGFSVHHAGINLLQKKFLQELVNTKILFFLANTIFVCQPLDQGIIKI